MTITDHIKELKKLKQELQDRIDRSYGMMWRVSDLLKSLEEESMSAFGIPQHEAENEPAEPQIPKKASAPPDNPQPQAEKPIALPVRKLKKAPISKERMEKAMADVELANQHDVPLDRRYKPFRDPATLPPARQRTNFTCTFEGCGKDAVAKGLCPKHYRQGRKATAESKSPEAAHDQRSHEDASARIEPIPPKSSPKWNPGTLSECCEAEVYSGPSHPFGNRYCGKCGHGCRWKSDKKLAVSWNCRAAGCKSMLCFQQGYCKKHWDALNRGKKEENELLEEIRSITDPVDA